MTETEISKQVLQALEWAFPVPRAWWHRNNVAGRKGRLASVGLGKGSADIVGCLEGIFVAVEVKRPGKWEEPDQLEWSAMHRLCGGVYVVAHSAQEAIDEIRKALEVVQWNQL